MIQEVITCNLVINGTLHLCSPNSMLVVYSNTWRFFSVAALDF